MASQNPYNNNSNDLNTDQNPLGILGVEFVEYTTASSFHYSELFEKLGFKNTAQSLNNKKIYLYQQGQIKFILNLEPNTFAADFAKKHGPSICSIGLKVNDASKAFELAVQRGGKAYTGSKESTGNIYAPAVFGIGDSLVYFMDSKNTKELFHNQFGISDYQSSTIKGYGLDVVDHFTNNVPKGEMVKWCEFYKNVFGFKEVRHFDIKGKQTGLASKVMRSPCGTFSIPINEPTESKSQIQEYLDEYKGSGIQHLALTTDNIIETLEIIRNKNLEFLTPPPNSYYEMLKDRLPQVNEDLKRLEKNAILVDGDHEGYLLQIFTKNVIGPIFYEIIQRKNHFGFGEGNFQALFDAIERDQKARGYL